MARPDAPWQVKSSREVYRNRWIRVREDEVVRPNGAESIYGVVECIPGVAVIARTDADLVYLVGQYRHTIDRYSWEIPAGGIDPAEDPLRAAQRELAEETGLTAARWAALGSFHPADGISSLVMHLFLAEDLRQGTRQPEATELLTLRVVSLTQALAEAEAGLITDGPTLIGLYRLWYRRWAALAAPDEQPR